MFNPFKNYYRITEFKNQNGETKFVATYSSLVWRFFDHIEPVRIYINRDGWLHREKTECESFEKANKAVQKHKTRAVDEFNAKYKKSAIHYVE